MSSGVSLKKNQKNRPRRVSLNILHIWALRRILQILILSKQKICVFFLQLILEYTRKLVLVPRCPFSDLSSEGLVKEKSQNRPRRVSLNISLCLKRGAAHARYALENSFYFCSMTKYCVFLSTTNTRIYSKTRLGGQVHFPRFVVGGFR